MWRISLPFGIAGAVVIVSLALYAHYDNEKKAQEKEIEAAAFKQKISTALANASSEGKEWLVSYEQEPVSGKSVARNAYIISNDSLCRLVVEKRSDNTELTGLYCPDFNMSAYDDIEIRFDDDTTSHKIDIGKFNNNTGIYISPYIFVSPGYIGYEKFINRLKAGKTLAINIPSEEDVWVTFSLKGSPEALSKLGKKLESSD